MNRFAGFASIFSRAEQIAELLRRAVPSVTLAAVRAAGLRESTATWSRRCLA
jgi:hypothetical protein